MNKWELQVGNVSNRTFSQTFALKETKIQNYLALKCSVRFPATFFPISLFFSLCLQNSFSLSAFSVSLPRPLGLKFLFCAELSFTIRLCKSGKLVREAEINFLLWQTVKSAQRIIKSFSHNTISSTLHCENWILSPHLSHIAELN